MSEHIYLLDHLLTALFGHGINAEVQDTGGLALRQLERRSHEDVACRPPIRRTPQNLDHLTEVVDTPQDAFEHFEPLAPVATEGECQRAGDRGDKYWVHKQTALGQRGVDPLHYFLRSDVQRSQDSLRRLILLFEKCDQQVLCIDTTVCLSPRDSHRPLYDFHSGLGERLWT